MNKTALLETLNRLKADRSGINLEAWKRDVLEWAADDFYADRAVFFSQQGNAPALQITRNTGSENNQAYLSYFYALDPFGFLAKCDDGLALVHGPRYRKSVVRLEDVAPSSTWRSSEYYNDFLRPMRIRDETIVYLRSRQRILGILSIMRTQSKPFNGREVDRLKLVAPYLTATLETLLLRQKTQIQQLLLDLYEEQAAGGFLVLNAAMDLLYANQPAMEAFPGLAANNLPAAVLAQCKRLQKAVDRDNVCRNPAPVRTRLAVGGREVGIETRRVDGYGGTAADHLFAVCLDPIRKSALNRERIQSHFSLTRREAEIVECLFRGLTNKQIADTLFIGETTVKKHLQNICGKMKLKNRTGILHTILSTFDMI